MTSFSHWSNLGLGAVSRMTRAAHNMLLVPQLRWSPEEYDEDFSHLPHGFILQDDLQWQCLEFV